MTYTRFKSPIVSFSYCQYARCKGITQRDLDVNRRKCETDQTKLRLTHVHWYKQQRVQNFVWLPNGSKLLILLPTKEMFTCNFAYKTQFNGGSSQHQPNKLYIKWIKIWCETIINLNFSYRIRFKRKTAVQIQWNQATARQRRKSTTVEFIHTQIHIFIWNDKAANVKKKQNTNTEIKRSMAKQSELNANVNKAFDTCAPNEC